MMRLRAPPVVGGRVEQVGVVREIHGRYAGDIGRCSAPVVGGRVEQVGVVARAVLAGRGRAGRAHLRRIEARARARARIEARPNTLPLA